MSKQRNTAANHASPVTFHDWTRHREVGSLGTNSGARELPFQQWRPFKEAFAPELIERAVTESVVAVKHCVDPFGGSGTTSLAAQFLGIRPTTIEVNPYLSDLIKAKLDTYDVDQLAADLGEVIRSAGKNVDVSGELAALPPTFVEPGVQQRWLFDKSIATRIMRLRAAIHSLCALKHRRLFRVILGGALIDLCNAITSGKGRRYRMGWESRQREIRDVDSLFCANVRSAITELHRYSHRACKSYKVLRGDCRVLLDRVDPYDLAVFSPPYPNSFDYTDVYNVELWMLGYLRTRSANRKLRISTLSSHVQLRRTYATPPSGSPVLSRVLRGLEAARGQLWSRWLPEMVGGYFADIDVVLEGLRRSIVEDGQAWLVVGDSRYGGIHIPTARIISELIEDRWSVVTLEPFRSMRVSPQQGGRRELAETLLVLSKPRRATNRGRRSGK